MADTPSHRNLGDRGEWHAANYLSNLGFKVIARNFHTRRGEVDLVVSRGGELCFVEVKAWSSTKMGPAMEGIPLRKRRRIGWAAQEWLCRFGGDYEQITLGVLILEWRGGQAQIEFVQDAFELPG